VLCPIIGHEHQSLDNRVFASLVNHVDIEYRVQ